MSGILGVSTRSGTPRGRYAPSPTGEIHIGNASSALLAWLSVRSRGGSFVMRMEDLDRNRIRPGLDGQVLNDLSWLGIDWDEGPDLGGPFEPYEQWVRRERYASALARLRESGQVYPCFCSRKDIASAASAPQTPGDEVRYPGSCRGIGAGEARDRIAGGARHAWRFRVDGDQALVFEDLVHGTWGAGRRTPGDFVVARADGVPAYQLAVVVDDAEMGISEVVRGDDLLPSTTRQILLYHALGLVPPVFGHVPLLLGPDGVRLSKRHEGTTLRELRQRGLTPDQLVGRLVFLLGIAPSPDAVSAAKLVCGFSLKSVQPVPDGIRIDPATW